MPKPNHHVRLMQKNGRNLMHVFALIFFLDDDFTGTPEWRRESECLKGGKSDNQCTMSYFPIGRPSGMLYVPTLV